MIKSMREARAALIAAIRKVLAHPDVADRFSYARIVKMRALLAMLEAQHRKGG
jgi:hypothetical protein